MGELYRVYIFYTFFWISCPINAETIFFSLLGEFVQGFWQGVSNMQTQLDFLHVKYNVNGRVGLLHELVMGWIRVNEPLWYVAHEVVPEKLI